LWISTRTTTGKRANRGFPDHAQNLGNSTPHANRKKNCGIEKMTNAIGADPQLFTARTDPDGLQADAWSHEPLLLSLEMGGSNWASSCRNGTCRTCIGQLVSGQVRYELEWPGLSAEEMAQGCVLPCVAFPCSDVTLRAGF
jgi:ferredoxin